MGGAGGDFGGIDFSKLGGAGLDAEGEGEGAEADDDDDVDEDEEMPELEEDVTPSKSKIEEV